MTDNIIIGMNSDVEVTCALYNDIFCEINSNGKDLPMVVSIIDNFLPGFENAFYEKFENFEKEFENKELLKSLKGQLSENTALKIHNLMHSVSQLKPEEELKALATDLPKIAVTKNENEDEITIITKNNQSIMHTKVKASDLDRINKKAHSLLSTNINPIQRKRVE